MLLILQVAVFLPVCSCGLFEFEDTSDGLYRYLPDDIKEEMSLINALDRIFDFFFSDFERVNFDGLLGIILSEGQLNIIMRKLLIKNSLFDTILNLQKKCHNLIKLLKSKVKLSSLAYYKLYHNILNTKLWELDLPFDTNSLEDIPLYNWTVVPLQVLTKRVFYNGSPNGKESEICITELIDARNIPFNEEHDCMPSAGCIVIMSQLNTSHGYPLTHKLLYIQIARALQCKLNLEEVAKSTKYLCSRILREYRSIENILQKDVLLQDLYFEQMVLCGLEGYAEFLTPKSRQNLLEWQTGNGCYGVQFPQPDNRWRTKREISNMKYGCESHITGLAAAALSLNLNFLISSKITNLNAAQDDDDYGYY